MSKVEELLSLIRMERLEEDLFRGISKHIGSPNVFGGQVLAQAMSAATQTVEEGRLPHSLHGYFILAGDMKAPIIYQVQRTRDGGSFSTRRVTAIQHGKSIFHAAISFQKMEEGHEHQNQMPDVPKPDELDDIFQTYLAYFDKLPESFRKAFVHNRPIDFRPTVAINPFFPDKAYPPERYVWIRANGTLDSDNLLDHQMILAYASDFNLLATAMLPHQLGIISPGIQLASLDHAMWFHRPFRADEWLLYALDSPSASGARGFCRGSLFDMNGNLVASVAQEGLMRIRKKKPKS
jgi:acyl-CoA thioesterase-2